MEFSSFSFLISIIWVSIFSIIIEVFSKQMFFLRTFSIYPLIFFICFCIIRFFLPIELFYTQIIRSENLLPVLQHTFNLPLMALPIINIPISLISILIFINCVVALYTIIRKINEYKRFYNILCLFSGSEDQHVKSILNKIQELTGLKKNVKIIVHNSIKTPAIVGFHSPIIILPDIFFSDEELYGVLLHEWQHYCQGHAIIKCVCDIIQTLFWWNPFFKHFKSVVEHTLEMHSDEKVSYYLNKQQQKHYLNAIIKVINNQKEDQKKTILTCCLVEETESKHLKQRFKMLLENNYSKINKQRSILFVPILFALFVLSYSYVIQPYSNPSIQDYGVMAEISNDDYLVKMSSGYNLYNNKGELIANIIVIDDNLRHLKIINEEDLQ